MAVLVGVAVSALAGGSGRASQFLAWTLVAFAFAQLPLGLATTVRLSSLATRQAVLARALLAGVTLSTTAWFASLALATGQAGLPVYVLLAVLVLGYGLGFLVTGRLARTAVQIAPRGPDDPLGP